jgi:hypothetical protein
MYFTISRTQYEFQGFLPQVVFEEFIIRLSCTQKYKDQDRPCAHSASVNHKRLPFD